MALLTLFFAYALIKFEALVYHGNPNISTALYENEFPSQLKVKYDDIGFKIAFGIENFFNRENLANPDYVKFYAAYEEQVNGVYTQTLLPFDKCTEEDYA